MGMFHQAVFKGRWQGPAVVLLWVLILFYISVPADYLHKPAENVGVSSDQPENVELDEFRNDVFPGTEIDAPVVVEQPEQHSKVLEEVKQLEDRFDAMVEHFAEVEHHIETPYYLDRLETQNSELRLELARLEKALHRLDTPMQKAAQNSTIGFSRLIAVSGGTAWRVHGLQAAANLTGLDFEIPTHPNRTDEEMDEFANQNKDKAEWTPGRGATLAWMAHLDILKDIIDSNVPTAMIIEDDVDWSVRIKDQMSMLSDGVRNFTEVDSDDKTPYGDKWDVMWLGHCAEWYDNNVSPEKSVAWPDDTEGRREDWRSVYPTSQTSSAPEGQRSLQWAVSPLCSWAYAVTHEGAKRLYDRVKVAQHAAFDTKLRQVCLDGIQCLSVIDQLFNTFKLDEEFGSSSEVNNDHNTATLDTLHHLQNYTGSTQVILESARCAALYNKTCLNLGPFAP